MKLFQQFPEVQTYSEPIEFVNTFHITEKDFILASKSIYNKYFANLGLKAEIRFKSMYGNGEPTDAMVDALLADFRKTNCNRIIAIGGGAVIDMAGSDIHAFYVSASGVTIKNMTIKNVNFNVKRMGLK